MTPAEIDRVFGRGRLRMTTGEHVEVFREEARSDEERRYTKRFLVTASADLRDWTEREWRLLDRLGARGDAAVAKVVRFLPADDSGMARLQTRDAGVTVDQWSALVPLRRAAPVLPHVFGDCANWWALARQCLIALDPLHALGFVHLDFKADNVCIPGKPTQAVPPAPGQPLAPDFDALALIDVAFSLLPGVELPGPVPLAREPGYEYQSPRLLDALVAGRRGNLAPMLELDWRCDLFSLAAMLWRYLPELDDAAGTGWTSQRHTSATSFVRQLLQVHAEPLPAARPHRALIGQAALHLAEPQLAAALQLGSAFDPERERPHGAEAMPLTRVFTAGSARPPAAGRAGWARRREPTVAETIGPAAAPTVDVPLDATTDAPFDARTEQPLDMKVDVTLGAPVAEAIASPSTRPRVQPAAPPAPSTLAAAVGGNASMEPTPPPRRTPASPAPASPAAASPVAARPATATAQKVAAVPMPGRMQAQAAAVRTPAAKPSLRAVSPTELADEPPPRRPPAAAGQPPHPLPTPLPIVAAAGVGALLVVAAAWWGLDGRAMFDRMERQNAAPAAPVVGDKWDTPATAAALPSPTTAAAPPSDADAPAASPAATATTPADPSASRAEAAPPIASTDEFAPTAADWMTTLMPRIATSAERSLAPAFAAAAKSPELRQRSEVRAAVQKARASTAVAPDVQVHAREASALDAAAHVAYWRDHSLADAMRLQTQAFGANPLDAGIAGNLAFLRLQETPPQAEAARQLALHALTLRDEHFATGRIDDWTTLAIADALTGRDKDARNAWFVSMALTSDPQHQCDAAVRAQATYGDRLRPSVQPMLQRARSSAAYGRCAAPQSDPSTRPGKPAGRNAKSTQKPRHPATRASTTVSH